MQGTCLQGMLCLDALAKTHIRRGWDLASRIGRIQTHRMAARNPGGSPVSELARLPHVCRACDARMLAPAKTRIRREWDMDL